MPGRGMRRTPPLRSDAEHSEVRVPRVVARLSQLRGEWGSATVGSIAGPPQGGHEDLPAHAPPGLDLLHRHVVVRQCQWRCTPSGGARTRDASDQCGAQGVHRHFSAESVDAVESDLKISSTHSNTCNCSTDLSMASAQAEQQYPLSVSTFGRSLARRPICNGPNPASEALGDRSRA